VPEAPPTEYKVSPSGADTSITKLSWIPEHQCLLMLGKRNGVVEIWDTRQPGDNGPAVGRQIANVGISIMDLEISSTHGTVLVAFDDKV
jgi:hypothetical protein